MREKLYNFLYYFTLPGTVIHELAHATIIVLLPNIKITKLKLTSYVEYSGTSNTVPRTFLIGYAPFFINTSLSLLCIYALKNINYMAGYKELFYVTVLFYISLVSAFTALPSFQDAISPWVLMRRKLFTKRFPLIVLFSPLVIILSMPGLIISYTAMKSRLLQFIMCVIYTTSVVLVGFGFITGDMILIFYEYFTNSLEVLIDNLPTY